MSPIWKLCAFVGVAASSFVVYDPSDVIGTLDWTADNALVANYNVPFPSSQEIANVAPTYVTGKTITLKHKSLSVDKNDTSVIVITEGSHVHLTQGTILKGGYSSNLLEASFYGVNAAVWVGNGSTAYIKDTNITVHNGAASVYAYGTGTEVYADNLFSYSSGPVSHGLYASGNGTIYATDIWAYSGGMRSSIFSGDSPAGYIHASDSTVHSDGIGSAICYALGLCNVTNVTGHASSAPVMFMDSNQEGIWTSCDLTAGLLAGMALFGSAERQSGAKLTLNRTRLTVLGDTMPSLWFGNTIASVTIVDSVFNNTASNIFVIANTSQITQDFDYFAGPEQNSAILPAEVTLSISASPITGNLVAYNGSTIDVSFNGYSSWTGAAVWPTTTSYISVSLDSTSNWTLTTTSKVNGFRDADTSFANIESAGFNIYYNSSSQTNKYLGGKTVTLNGGGKLKPM